MCFCINFYLDIISNFNLLVKGDQPEVCVLLKIVVRYPTLNTGKDVHKFKQQEQQEKPPLGGAVSCCINLAYRDTVSSRRQFFKSIKMQLTNIIIKNTKIKLFPRGKMRLSV